MDINPNKWHDTPGTNTFASPNQRIFPPSHLFGFSSPHPSISSLCPSLGVSALQVLAAVALCNLLPSTDWLLSLHINAICARLFFLSIETFFFCDIFSRLSAFPRNLLFPLMAFLPYCYSELFFCLLFRSVLCVFLAI